MTVLSQGLLVVAQISPLSKVERVGALGEVEVVSAKEVVLRPDSSHAQIVWGPVRVVDEGYVPADVVLLCECEELVGQSRGYAEAP